MSTESKMVMQVSQIHMYLIEAEKSYSRLRLNSIVEKETLYHQVKQIHQQLEFLFLKSDALKSLGLEFLDDFSRCVILLKNFEK